MDKTQVTEAIDRVLNVSMVEILLKDKQKYLHAVYVLTPDASLQMHGCNYREFESVLEACWMNKIPSVRRDVLSNICHSLLGLRVTNKRCCTNVFPHTKYFVDPTCYE